MVTKGDCGRGSTGIDTRMLAGIEIARYGGSLLGGKAHLLTMGFSFGHAIPPPSLSTWLRPSWLEKLHPQLLPLTI